MTQTSPMTAREAPRQRLRKPTIISNSKTRNIKIRINITHTKVMGAISTAPASHRRRPNYCNPCAPVGYGGYHY